MAINGNQRQSTAINGNHLQTHVLRQQHGLKRTFAILDTRPDTILEARGHLHAMSEAIMGHQRSSAAVIMDDPSSRLGSHLHKAGAHRLPIRHPARCEHRRWQPWKTLKADGKEATDVHDANGVTRPKRRATLGGHLLRPAARNDLAVIGRPAMAAPGEPLHCVYALAREAVAHSVAVRADGCTQPSPYEELALQTDSRQRLRQRQK